MTLLRRLATLWLVVCAVAVAVLTGSALRHPVLSYYAVGVFLVLLEADLAVQSYTDDLDTRNLPPLWRRGTLVVGVLFFLPWFWPMSWLNRFRGLIDIVLAEAEEGSSDEPEGD